MIRHISLLTLRPGTAESDIEAIAEAIRALEGTVESIVSIQVGRDLGLGDDTATLAVVTDLPDIEGYEQYHDHPAHRAVLDQMVKPVLAGRTVAQVQI